MCREVFIFLESIFRPGSAITLSQNTLKSKPQYYPVKKELIVDLVCDHSDYAILNHATLLRHCLYVRTCYKQILLLSAEFFQFWRRYNFDAGAKQSNNIPKKVEPMKSMQCLSILTDSLLSFCAKMPILSNLC